MDQTVFNILNKKKFQEQALLYFRDKKNLFFLNGNSNQQNLIAISDENIIKSDDWQFGFISYDYKNQLEKLSSNHFDGIEFPEKHFFTPELLFKINDNEVITCYDVLVYQSESIARIIEEINAVTIDEKDRKELKVKSRITKDEYVQNVNHLKNHIQQGDIYEINYCQEFYAEEVEINPTDLYFKLNEISPAPFSCFVKCDDKYLLSSSPERFIKKKANKILSQPIKGTLKRGETEQEDILLKQQLLGDQKERSENVMIVDLVRNDLSKIAKRGSVSVDELFEIQTFSQVHQMVSTISADLKEGVNFDAIIKALFPMGSMTGAPKISSMQLIEKYEKTKRGLYSGTVGYIDPNGDFDFNVIIRSILYNQKEKYLSFIVGGAITDLSDPEKEYEECMLKAKAMFQVLKK